MAEQNTKVVTGEVRFSYANVWKPKAQMDGGKEQYSVALLIPKKDTKTVAAIEAAIEVATQKGLKEKWGGKMPPAKKFNNPLRDGDDEKPTDPNYKGMYFINCKSSQQPSIVDRAVNPILNQSEFYSGCYGKASINFYPFLVNGNAGVAVGLNNLQKLRDGEPLAGGSRAEDDFEAVAEEDIL